MSKEQASRLGLLWRDGKEKGSVKKEGLFTKATPRGRLLRKVKAFFLRGHRPYIRHDPTDPYQAW